MSDLPQLQPDHSNNLPRPRCPLCGTQSFKREEGRVETKWGMGAHRLVMLVCTHCNYVLNFYRDSPVWKLD